MFIAYIGGNSFVNSDFTQKYNEYPFDLIVWIYGLVPPVDCELSLNLKPRLFILDRQIIEFESYSVDSSLNVRLVFNISGKSYRSNFADLSIDISLVKSLSGASYRKVEGSLGYLLPIIKSFYGISNAPASLNLGIALKLNFARVINTLLDGRLWSDFPQRNLILKLNLSGDSGVVGSLPLAIPLTLFLRLNPEILGNISIFAPLYSDLSGFVSVRTSKNSLLINITNASVSECSLKGALINYGSDIYLLSFDGIYKGDFSNYLNSYARFKLENLESRINGRWTDLYLIGEADVDMLCNNYVCEARATLRDFDKRFRLPFGIRTRDITIEFNGKIKYLDYMNIERLKEPYQKKYNFIGGKK